MRFISFPGEEKLLQQRALQALEKQLLPAGLEDFNKDVLSGDSVSPKQIAEMAMNLPVYGRISVLIVQAPLNFLSIPKSDKAGRPVCNIYWTIWSSQTRSVVWCFAMTALWAKQERLIKKLQEKQCR